MRLTITQRISGVVLLCLCAWTAVSNAQEYKTVIGAKNQDLADGATMLKAGNAEEGLKLTLKGLAFASSIRERTAGNSNACAGHVMLEQPQEAIPYCNEALAINDRHWRALTNRALAYLELGRFEESDADLTRAEELAPSARQVKLVRAMFLDKTDPVAPHVMIDDRRRPPEIDDE